MRDCKTNNTNKEEALLKDRTAHRRSAQNEIGYVAGTKYDDKFKANIQQHRSLCQILEKEGYEVNLQPIILRTQGSIGAVFDCFKAARVDDPQQAIPARLHDHGLTSWAETIRSQRFLGY